MQINSIHSKIGIPIKCQRCGHERIYRGTNPFFTLCTRCRTTISLRKMKRISTGPEGDCRLTRTPPIEVSTGDEASIP